MSTTHTSRARRSTAALLLATAVLTGTPAHGVTTPAAGADGPAWSARERAVREGITHPWVVYRAEAAYVVAGADGGDARLIVRFAPRAGRAG